MSVVVGSPVDGRAGPLSGVDDPVFSQQMVGPGMAVTPGGGRGDAVAPIAGTVATLHPHAFVITAAGGTSVLVHLGIDTVKLEGEGFALHVAKGDAVEAGQPVVTWDPTEVEARGYSAVCPVVVLEVEAGALGDFRAEEAVAAGESLFSVRE